MRVGITAVLIGFLFVVTGCSAGDNKEKSPKKDPPPVVQDMNIVKPDDSSGKK